MDKIFSKKKLGNMSRRLFFNTGLTGLASAIVASMGGLIHFLFPKILYEPPMSFNAGYPDDYPLAEVSVRHREDYGVWIVHSREGIYALLSTCTHLGCQTNWSQDEMYFKCPCHGTNFNLQGDVIAGPAPQPLFRAAIKLNNFGQIVINKAVQQNKIKQRKRAPFLLKV